MSNSLSAAGRRLSLLGSSSAGVIGLLTLAGAGTVALMPTASWAASDCGLQSGSAPIICEAGTYPEIVYVGNVVDGDLNLVLEGAVLLPNGRIQVYNNPGGVSVTTAVGTLNTGDLAIAFPQVALDLSSWGGNTVLDLSDGDPSDQPGEIIGDLTVRTFSAFSTFITLDNVSLEANSNDAVFAFGYGDISVQAGGAISSGWGYGIHTFTPLGDTTITLSPGSSIVSGGVIFGGVLALGGEAISVTSDAAFGSDTELLPVAVEARIISGTPGGDINVVMNGEVHAEASVIAENQEAVGDVTVSFGESGPSSGSSLSAAISNAASTSDVSVTVGDGGALTTPNAISFDYLVSATNAGTGAAVISTGANVDLSGFDIGLSAVSGGAASLTLGDGSSLTLEGIDGSNFPAAQLGLQALSSATADADGVTSAAIQVGDDVEISLLSPIGWNSAGLAAAASVGTAGARVDTGANFQLTVTGPFAAGVSAVTNLGLIDVNIGSGSIVVQEGSSGFWFPTNPASAGVLAESNGGDIAIDVAADLNAVNSAGMAAGIYAVTTDGGDIIVAATGDTTAQPDSLFSRGMLAQAEDGDVTVRSNGDISAGAAGISAQASGAGSVSVTANGDITADTGIGASSGSGDVLVITGADSDIVSDGFGFGIGAESGGSVTIVANGDVSASFAGIFARRVTYVPGPSGPDDPPPPVIPGDVDVTVNGDVTSTGLLAAVIAQNDAVSGEVALKFGMDGSASLTSSGIGLLASNGSADNADAVQLTVGSGGAITAVAGVSAVTAGAGAVAVIIQAGSAITAQDAAINVTTAEGDAFVTIGGSAASATEAAVQVDSAGAATLNVGAGGLVQGATVAADIEADGAVTIANAGTIRTTAGGLADSLFAIDATSVTLGNTGTLIGSLDFSNLASFSATNGGTWRTSGESDFTSGDDTLDGSGVLATRAATIIDFDSGDDGFSTSGTLIVGDAAGASTLTLAGLESFASAGVILFGSVDGTTSDGEANDRLVAADVDFTGGLGSVLVMDVDLGQESQTSCDAAVIADCFSLAGGSTAGSTLIRVNDTGTSEAGINTAGIVLVDVDGGDSAADHFVLDPASPLYRADASGGVLAKGIFLYRLDYDADNQQHRLLGEPDRAIFELTPLAASVQNIWYAGAQTWLDQQSKPSPAGRRSGAWVRAIASSGERDLTQRFGSGGADFLIDVSHEQNTVGLQGGVDVVHEVGGGAVTLGAMLGSLDSDVRFDDSKARESLEGASYGAYAGWDGGRLFVNALFLVNDLDLEHRAGWGPDQGVGEVRSTGAQLEGGWRLGLGGVSVEPLAGLAYVRTSVDDLRLPGAELRTDDATSLRGSLGARASGGASLGTARVRFSATGRFWEEFEGNNCAVLVAGSEEIALGDDFGGSFGEVGAGFSLSSASGGVSFFANAGVKFGDEYESTDGAIGFRVRW